MALEKVISEIGNEAHRRAEKNLAEARKEASKIISDAKKKADEAAENTRKELDAEIGAMKQRQASSTKIALKKEELSTKKEIMEKVSEKAREKISKLKDKEALAKKLLQQAKKELPNAKYYYCAEKDKPMFAKLAKGLSFKEPANILGGVILEDANGELMVNYSFDVILRKVLESEMKQIYGKVFA